jgi:outer membrane protein assembly factor BamB
MKPLRLLCWLPAVLLGAAFVLVLNPARPGPADRGPGAAAVETVHDACPMFGGTVHRNMVNTVDTGIADNFSVQPGQEKDVKWQAQLGSTAYGGPVIAGGKVFVGTNNEKPRDPKVTDDKGVLMCFRESDGKFLWQRLHDKLASDNDFPMQGIASTPTVEGKYVYYVSNRCEVVRATTDGTTDWQLDLVGELKVYPCQLAACSPLVVGAFVYVVTDNGRDQQGMLPSPRGPSFVAVHKQTGKVAWKSDAPGEKIIEGQWSNPTYAEVDGKGQVIFPGGDGVLYAFEPAKGELLWKFDCNPKSAEDKPGGRGATRNALIATPVVHEGRLYVGVGRNPEEGAGVGHLWCVDLAKATAKGATNKDHEVSPAGDNFDPKAAANKDSALAWHYGGPVAEKGPRKYTFGRTISTVAVHDGLVYASELDGFLHCLDARTGQKYWEADLQATVWASPYYVDGKVYIGTDNGDLFVFPAEKQKGQPRTIDMGHPVKSSVVAVNGVLYVQTDSVLFAIGKK